MDDVCENCTIYTGIVDRLQLGWPYDLCLIAAYIKYYLIKSSPTLLIFSQKQMLFCLPHNSIYNFPTIFFLHFIFFNFFFFFRCILILTITCLFFNPYNHLFLVAHLCYFFWYLFLLLTLFRLMCFVFASLNL